jgi:hypothetical protein
MSPPPRRLEGIGEVARVAPYLAVFELEDARPVGDPPLTVVDDALEAHSACLTSTLLIRMLGRPESVGKASWNALMFSRPLKRSPDWGISMT